MSTLTSPIAGREPDTILDQDKPGEDPRDTPFEFPELGTAGFLPQLDAEQDPDVR